MTELLPPPAKKKSIHRFLIPIVLVIAAVAALGYFASKAGLDRALVKQEVDAWIERSKAHAAKEGYDLAIVYDDVSIKGGLTDGHALITNIKIINSPDKDGISAGDKSVTFTTDEVRLEPKSANLRDVEIVLPAPIHIFEGKNTAESAAIFGDTALTFEVEQLGKDKQVFNRIFHSFPSKVTFRYLVGQDAMGEEDKEQELTPRYDSIEVTMDSGSAEVLTHHNRSEIGNSNVTFNNVKVVPVGHEEGAVTIDKLSSVWSNALNDKGLNVIDAQFELGNLQADEKFLPYAPINASFSAHFEGAMPSTPEEFAHIQTQQTAFKLSDFSFSIKDASVNGNADFVANQEDILPVGYANVTVQNVQAWREALKANDMLKTQDEELINTFFIRITGETLAAAKDVSVDVKRVRDGAFQIGNITFEEALAIALRQVKTPLDTEPAAPVEPVETKAE